MFWKLSPLSASSPVDAVLDKDNFTLDELLEEEEIIQECKALNSRLINFLRDRTQVEQLLRYVIEEPLEDADSSRTFKFPFVACEVFTCEIDVILRTLVEDEELMDLLFSFLDPNRLHSPLLAGYFSKVVVCLMLRKTVPLMNYVQAHQGVLCQLVDLIGITSIMEVLVRLVGADDHAYPIYLDIMQWLSDSNLLEMIVDKLSPSSPPEVQANAAETLCAITRNAGSSLATKLSSPRFVSRILGHALEDSHSKSGLVHSLSVCISLLDPRRSVSSYIHSVRGQHMYEAPITVNADTVSAMLPNLGDLVMLLSVTTDDKVLPMPYGELRPPLGKHRLKIVEFISVLLKAGNAAAEEELVKSGIIKRVIALFFEYPYNNALHHHVESIILSCMESKNDDIVDHLFQECDLINKILQADRQSLLSDDPVQPTVPAPGKQPPRRGNLGHITRIANKILQLGQNNGRIRTYLQEGEWNEWQATVLQERNVVWNVYRWGCGRPTTLHDRTRDSDDDILHDRDYDVATLANNLSQAFRPDLFVTEGSEEDNGAVNRDDEDVYFNDDSAEVVISSLRLGDDQGSLFTNSNWFTFRDERIDNAPGGATLSDIMDEIYLNENAGSSNSGSDDEVVVGEDEELNEPKDHHMDSPSGSNQHFTESGSSTETEKMNIDSGAGPFQFETSTGNTNPFGDVPPADWARFPEPSDSEVGRSSLNPFLDSTSTETQQPTSISSTTVVDSILENGTCNSPELNAPSPPPADTNKTVTSAPSLFEEDVEFLGVEPEGTEKAMEQALKEGIVGEAGPLKRSPTKPATASVEEKAADVSTEGMKEFNDANYWRVEQEVAVLE